MADVFISYSRKDEGFARQLAESFSIAGLDVWIDVDDIPVGMKWSSAIERGLKQSQLMIVVITPDSMQSRNVEDEWQYFRDKNKPIVPVLRRPTEVHYQLARYQRIDFYSQPYEDALDQLFREMQRLGLELQGESAAEISATLLKRPPAAQTLLKRPPEFEAPLAKEQRQRRSGLMRLIMFGVMIGLIGGATAIFISWNSINGAEMAIRTATAAARATIIAADQARPTATFTLSATPTLSTTPAHAPTETQTPVAAASQPEPAALTPTQETRVLLLVNEALNIREQDDPAARRIGTVARGRQVVALGINHFRTWWYIEYVDTNGTALRGWISDVFVTAPEDVSSVPTLTVQQARELP